MAEIIAMPKLGFDMAEGTLVRWVILEGGEVAKGAVLAEIETDKATVEVEASASGILHKQLVTEGSVVPVGTPIAVIAAPGEEVADVPESGSGAAAEVKPAEIAVGTGPTQTVVGSQPEPAQQELQPDDGQLKASPLAKKIAAEKNVNLRDISGSGPGGRIVKRDVESAVVGLQSVGVKPEVSQQVQPTKASLPAAVWVPSGTVPADEHIPVVKLRAIIGKRMLESKQQVPHFYITSAYDAAPLLKLRQEVNAQLPEDSKVSLNDFIIKAAALTLRLYPNINASITEKEIIRRGHINVGVAVALDIGLMTVVVKDADQKPVRIIAQEMREMAARARSGKVRPEDIEGSSFSISNLGMYNVEDFAAIINPPEAAILAIGSAKPTPVVVGDEVKVGMQVRMTISADHRVTDGAEAARFMNSLGEFIENPIRLLL